MRMQRTGHHSSQNAQSEIILQFDTSTTFRRDSGLGISVPCSIGSGPDPYGLGTTISGVCPANTGIHSQPIAEKGPEKMSCYAGAGVGIGLIKHN